MQSDLRNASAAAISCRSDVDATGVPNDFTDCDDSTVLGNYDFNPSAGVSLTFTGTTANRMLIQASGPESVTGDFDSDTGRVTLD